jgi:2-amino-4-hydroxy-6-hydroxymethyldihydropteridine diphosphokinase
VSALGPGPHGLGLEAPGPTTRRAFVALGSNLGDRRAYLRSALAFLPGVVAVSPVYETEPVGGPAGQGAYLNAVVELATDAEPEALLAAAQGAERAARRVRAERWGPRTLDVDLLLVGDERRHGPELTLPHPRLYERGFVLVPLADLAPELVEGRLTPALRQGVSPAGSL